ncbi:hypothetical protein LCGC14_2818110, partial [marine sediment metagenome]
DLDPDIIKASDSRAKTKHKDMLNDALNEDYKKFWAQDSATLKIEWDSDHMEFWIKEGENFEPQQRSTGKRWHLGFFINVSARAKENKGNNNAAAVTLKNCFFMMTLNIQR